MNVLNFNIRYMFIYMNLLGLSEIKKREYKNILQSCITVGGEWGASFGSMQNKYLSIYRCIKKR